MTEFWWALVGLGAVVALAWMMNWSRWDPKAEGRDHAWLHVHHHAG